MTFPKEKRKLNLNAIKERKEKKRRENDFRRVAFNLLRSVPCITHSVSQRQRRRRRRRRCNLDESVRESSKYHFVAYNRAHFRRAVCRRRRRRRRQTAKESSCTLHALSSPVSVRSRARAHKHEIAPRSGVQLIIISFVIVVVFFVPLFSFKRRPKKV